MTALFLAWTAVLLVLVAGLAALTVLMFAPGGPLRQQRPRRPSSGGGD